MDELGDPSYSKNKQFSDVPVADYSTFYKQHEESRVKHMIGNSHTLTHT